VEVQSFIRGSYPRAHAKRGGGRMKEGKWDKGRGKGVMGGASERGGGAGWDGASFKVRPPLILE